MDFAFDYSITSGVFDDFFFAVGYDEITGTYSAFGANSLKRLRELKTGIKYIRIHNMFTGPKGDLRGVVDAGCDPVKRDEQGLLIFDWAKLDAVYDTLINNGYIPYIEFGFMPDVLSSAPLNKKGRWKNPPKDYDEWRTLIRECVKHLKDKYPEKHKLFIYEVWNEPDAVYFKGSIKEYIKLYDYTVAALYDIFPDGDFKIGGPAVALRMLPFFKKFLKHCLYEKNHITEQIGAKLDFISFHLKGGLYFPTPSIKKIFRNLRKYMKTIASFKRNGKNARKFNNSAYLPDDVEIHITELDPVVGCAKGVNVNSKFEFRNNEYYSSYTGYIATLLQQFRKNFNHNISLVFSDNLHFSDEAGTIFKGCRSLTTAPFASLKLEEALKDTQVIVKPVVKAYQILNLMKGEMLKQENPLKFEKTDVSALCTKKDNDIYLLFSNFNPKFNETNSKRSNAVIKGLLDKFKSAEISHYVVDATKNNTYKVWIDLKRPTYLDESMFNEIREEEKLKPLKEFEISIENSKIQVSVELKPYSLNFFEIKLL